MTSWTRSERRWRDALLAAMIPAGSLPSLASLPVGDFWERFRDAASPLLCWGLRIAVVTLTLAAPLFLMGRARTFPALDADDQDELLRRAAASRWYLLRQMVTTVKAVACFAYLRDGTVRLRLEAAR